MEEVVKVTDRELIEAKFRSADANNDGLISFDEFMSMIGQS